MLQAQSLSKLPGIRHGFFTRAGGVSEGVYESLNGGVGSEIRPPRSPRTAPAWRSISALRQNVSLTCYQIHSPEVVVAETPWPSSGGPAPTRS